MRGGPWHIFHFHRHGGFDRNADEGFIAPLTFRFATAADIVDDERISLVLKEPGL